MRISDWSSDVCSSDLSKVVPVTATAHSRSVEFPGVRIDVPRVSWVQGIADPERPRPRVRWVEPGAPPFRQSFVFFKSTPSAEVLLFLVRPRSRKTVVQGTSVSVRDEIGGRRFMQKKTT